VFVRWSSSASRNAILSSTRMMWLAAFGINIFVLIINYVDFSEFNINPVLRISQIFQRLWHRLRESKNQPLFHPS
jgi:hypothetical protein